MSDKKLDPTVHSQTKLIHAGVMRSQWEETGEAIFLTSGFVYECAVAGEVAV